MKQAIRSEERLNSALIHYFVKCASGCCIPEPCLVVYGIFHIAFCVACYKTSEKTINPMLRPLVAWRFIVLINPRQREFLPLDPEQRLCPCNPAESVATLHSQKWASASPLTLQSGERPPIPQCSKFFAFIAICYLPGLLYWAGVNKLLFLPLCFLPVSNRFDGRFG